MRSLEECKAEIFRRSEEKIIAEKWRKKKIALCIIPSFICVLIAAVLIFPQFSQNKNAEFMNTADTYYEEESAGNDTAAEEELVDDAETDYDGDYSKNENKAPSSNAIKGDTSSTTEISIASDDVKIYIAQENGIKETEVFLALTPQTVFSAWKKHNGIGDEVELIDVEIESNSTTETKEHMGSQIVTHTVGDRFVLNIKISKNIESYYSVKNKDFLLKSLKRTMTEYNGMEYAEYNLILE